MRTTPHQKQRCGGSGVLIHGGDLSTLVPGNVSIHCPIPRHATPLSKLPTCSLPFTLLLPQFDLLLFLFCAALLCFTIATITITTTATITSSPPPPHRHCHHHRHRRHPYNQETCRQCATTSTTSLESCARTSQVGSRVGGWVNG